jgi:integrase
VHGIGTPAALLALRIALLIATVFLVGAHLAGWHEACEAAGVPGLLFHDLRRSAVRNMKRAGNPDKAVMEISGHKTRSVFDRYDIISNEDITSVAQRTEEYLKARKEALKDSGESNRPHDKPPCAWIS